MLPISALIDGKSNISYQDIYMQKVIVLTLTLALASLLLLNQGGKEKTSSEVFDEWRNTHGLMLDLSPQDLEYRLRIFQKNVKAIEEHNSNPAHSYKQGVNQFTAYTKQEFEAMYLSHFDAHPTTPESKAAAPIVGLNVDWVSYGAVSPVKNQGSCTASYAFSAIGGIEGISVIFYKQQQEYSVQQVIDCSSSYGNAGCATGNMFNSYNYIAAKGTPLPIQASKLNYHTPTLVLLVPARSILVCSRSRGRTMSTGAVMWRAPSLPVPSQSQSMGRTSRVISRASSTTASRI